MSELGRYLTAGEKSYREKRRQIVNEVENETLADCPFLFANRITVTEAIARYELFRKIVGISGAIVECGTYKGNNLLFFGHLSSILEPYAINRQILGFDSFEGFRSLTDNDPSDLTEEQLSDASYEVLNGAIDLYDMNRAASHIRRVKAVKGDACDTIPEYVENHPELTIAMLYLDFDIYQPTKVALENLAPLVSKGGIIAFDELNYDKFSGETQAMKEYFQLNEVKVEKFPFAPFIAYIEL